MQNPGLSASLPSDSLPLLHLTLPQRMGRDHLAPSEILETKGTF